MSMGFGRNVRRWVLGSRTSERSRGATIAVGLFLLTGLVALVSHVVYHENPQVILWLFVLLGVGLSVVFAYRNSGLVVSLLLVFGPVLGPVAFYRWLMIREGKGPVALFLSFHGYGAAGFWIPTAFVLGSVAFGVGAIARRGTNYLDSESI